MKLVLGATLLLIFFLFNSSVAYGCGYVPSDSSILSSDSKYILVMFDKTFAKDYQVKGSLRKYPSSGIYENNGSIIPIHVIEDWFGFEGRGVELANDGSHFARLTYKSIELYNEGLLLKSYPLSALGLPPPLPRSGDCPKTWWASTKIDNGNNRLTVESKQGDYLYFDLLTGNEIGKDGFIIHFLFGEDNFIRNVIILAFIATIILPIYFVKRRRKKEWN